MFNRDWSNKKRIKKLWVKILIGYLNGEDPKKVIGDYIPGKILQSRKLNEISVYAREGGQNTKNQPIKEDQL